jgi:uncharacterized LabA/DUF88 family protein
MVNRKGFKTTIYERDISKKERKVDVAIGARMTNDAYTLVDKEKDELLLVAGDKDFEPVITDLTSENFKIVTGPVILLAPASNSRNAVTVFCNA